MRKKAVYTINSDDGIPICCVCKLQIGEGDDNCLNCALYESEQEIERFHATKDGCGLDGCIYAKMYAHLWED
jgi:hypothetical protein